MPLAPAIGPSWRHCPQIAPAWVFTNARTQTAATRSTAWRTSFKRAVERAGITTGDVTLHTLRHTALSRMIASGIDDYTVMAISGHSSTRMLERYTHPTEARKIDALESLARSHHGHNDTGREQPNDRRIANC